MKKIILINSLLFFINNTLFCQISWIEHDVYKEIETGLMYDIQGSKKILLPTEDAKLQMGLSYSKILSKPKSELDRYSTIRWESLSKTPGSMVFPTWANNEIHGTYPYDYMSNSINFKSRGRIVYIGELRGWIRHLATDFSADSGGDGDFHYAFELDTEWALSKGYNLNKMLTVGNIMLGDKDEQWNDNPSQMYGFPLIVVEIQPFQHNWGQVDKIPSDWTYQIQGNSKTLGFPFNPLNINGTLLQEGSYIRMVGSLVSDNPHVWNNNWGGWHLLGVENWKVLGKNLNWKVYADAVITNWDSRNYDTDVNHVCRYNEMHPPDYIEVLSKEHRITTKGIALCARPAKLLNWRSECREIDVDIYPEQAKPATGILNYNVYEDGYPATYFPNGTKKDCYHKVTRYIDHINVKAKVCGEGIGGSAGRFKALYTVWWEAPPYRLNTTATRNSENKATLIFELAESTGQTQRDVLYNGQKIGVTNSPFSFTINNANCKTVSGRKRLCETERKPPCVWIPFKKNICPSVKIKVQVILSDGKVVEQEVEIPQYGKSEEE